ncbi:MAG: DNA repair protein RecN [Oscillospiraceae bacterium]|jgi:DNA repair protein RecN (Recombination protein N)|nr:DNA repair protein RecN [Oscillospiraceae bacterium]
MLSNLKIENIAIIESASIDFTEKLNCFTGETGAGKSIIIDAINAVLGEKTSRELIRTGAQSAKVTAFFTGISKQVRDALASYDLPAEPDDSLLVQRSLMKDGKNVCRINGEPVTVSILKAVGLCLVNIHGQSDNQALFSSEKHYQYIDSLAGNDALCADYSALFLQLKQIKKQIADMTANEQQKEQRMDMLRFQINELEAANIAAGEIAELQAKQKLAQNAQKITESLRSAYDYLNGNYETPGAADLAAPAAHALQNASLFLPEAEKLYNIVYEASIILSDVTTEISTLLLEMDGEIAIDDVEERLDLLYRLRKKYGDTEEEMLAFLEAAKREYDSMESSEHTLAKLHVQLENVKEQALYAAKKLSAARQKAARQFESGVAGQLKFLDMPNITFLVKTEQAALSETGMDAIEFLISPNAGERPKPLSKIASGGELSRIMLAIKTVLAGKDEIETLIFDEIDTGVSGRAAEKIGLKLKEVSAHRQVLCVTHLAQIAALADTHLFIEKEVRDAKTFTRVTSLDFAGRRKEIARITSGIDITDLQLQNAEEMLRHAGHTPE